MWHVFRFRERFELADDQRFCRKGPLIYARDYITPADDESCAYLQQIESLRRQADGPVHLGGVLGQVRRRCNMAALQAGKDIYRALGSPWPDDSPESAREVGCFSAAFEKAVASGLPPTVLVELWESLVKEARRLAKLYSKNGGYRSAARVWCSKILPGKLAAAAQQRSPPERAAV